ncbi:hypothetical protein DFH09DRAFT_1094842 [Mycena vulgaris]|nr:hypothetical protein DFH09DRAFT_1094842 [Mycena vulgaris]
MRRLRKREQTLSTAVTSSESDHCRSISLKVNFRPVVTGTNYLGILINWTDGGKIHRAVLEFIKLTESHTGKYLAKVFADCLERFGLAELAFIHFFFKELKHKKVVKVGKGRTGTRGRPTARLAAQEDTVAEEGDDLTPVEEEIAQLLESNDGSAVDDVAQSQDLHDNHVARSVRDRAIASMALDGSVIDPEENRAALRLFPKVAGLAKKAHDSGTVADTFNSLVDVAKATGKIQSDKTALDRCCPTYWNSELACLNAHNVLKVAVESHIVAPASSLFNFKTRLRELPWRCLDPTFLAPEIPSRYLLASMEDFEV